MPAPQPTLLTSTEQNDLRRDLLLLLRTKGPLRAVDVVGDFVGGRRGYTLCQTLHAMRDLFLDGLAEAHVTDDLYWAAVPRHLRIVP